MSRWNRRIIANHIFYRIFKAIFFCSSWSRILLIPCESPHFLQCCPPKYFHDFRGTNTPFLDVSFKNYEIGLITLNKNLEISPIWLPQMVQTGLVRRLLLSFLKVRFYGLFAMNILLFLGDFDLFCLPQMVRVGLIQRCAIGWN